MRQSSSTAPEPGQPPPRIDSTFRSHQRKGRCFRLSFLRRFRCTLSSARRTCTSSLGHRAPPRATLSSAQPSKISDLTRSSTPLTSSAFAHSPLLFSPPWPRLTSSKPGAAFAPQLPTVFLSLVPSRVNQIISSPPATIAMESSWPRPPQMLWHDLSSEKHLPPSCLPSLQAVSSQSPHHLSRTTAPIFGQSFVTTVSPLRYNQMYLVWHCIEFATGEAPYVYRCRNKGPGRHRRHHVLHLLDRRRRRRSLLSRHRYP